MASDMSAHVTIEDVAQRAAVSAMTVSRYLNNTGPVADKTAERIRAAIIELNYIPHQGARALAANKTNTIGFILPEMNDIFFFQLIHGIQQVVAHNEFDLLLYSTTQQEELNVLNLPLGRHNTDGLIIFTNSLNDISLRRLHRINFPLVLLHHTPPEDLQIPYVTFENKKGAYQMVEHLIACGHQHIAFLAGAPGNEDSYWRQKGYRQALDDYQIPFHPDLVAEADFSEERASVIVSRWLNEDKTIDAIFAADDVSARGAIWAVQAAGLRVPEDIAVAGFDDALLSQYVDPPLTTVRAPIEEAGRAAATQLIRLIRGEPADPLTLLPTELVIRRSCGWQNGRSS
ncbi:MAG: LacI family DNA-binding transcriptional regulator [Candidatus Promineifilaceae bacterium]|nr:LacI family DNA-binding transcriptional regulator [Candidatus Promineifilaceae bacterium]